MVYVTEDWPAFEGYVENCRVGTFQVKDNVDGVEIRVKAGRLGYIHVFQLNDEPQRQQYDRIQKFCKTQGFVKVEYALNDEIFHS